MPLAVPVSRGIEHMVCGKPGQEGSQKAGQVMRLTQRKASSCICIQSTLTLLVTAEADAGSWRQCPPGIPVLL